jgi:hypothetical protein
LATPPRRSCRVEKNSGGQTGPWDWLDTKKRSPPRWANGVARVEYRFDSVVEGGEEAARRHTRSGERSFSLLPGPLVQASGKEVRGDGVCCG